MKKALVYLTLAAFVFSCTHDPVFNPLDFELEALLAQRSPDGDPAHYQLPSGRDLSILPQWEGNPLTPEKVALGRMLFFETGLAQNALHESGRGTYSCGTCHVPSAGFMPGRVQGIADGGAGFGLNGESRDKQDAYEEGELDVQGLRPLSLLNVTYVTNSTWNGRFGAGGVNEGTEEHWDDDEATHVNYLGMPGLESQNIEGLRLHRMVVNRAHLDSLGYLPMYDAAFSDFPEEERYSELTTSFAISAYIRSLTTTQAPFQRWLRGEQEALKEQEKRGALLFFGKAGCYRCHQGPALNAMEFHALGVFDLHENAEVFATSPEDARNFGRGDFTKRAEDMYKFKVPQLYNLADSPFYFHGSSKRSLRAVVEYFNRGIPENPNVPAEQVSPFFHPLNLTQAEIDDLTAFLRNGLNDPDLERFSPESVLSGNCFPNNDPASRHDLGCN